MRNSLLTALVALFLAALIFFGTARAADALFSAPAAQAVVLNADLLVIASGSHTGTLIIGGEDGRLLRSTDAGLTWNPVVIEGKYNIVDVVAHPQGAIFAVTQEGLLRSVDDGLHWGSVVLPVGQRINRIVYHAVSRQWIAVSMNGAVLISQDEGASWQVSFQNPTKAPLTTIAANDAGTLIAGGLGGNLIYSSNGRQWRALTSNTNATITRILPLPGSAGMLVFWENGQVSGVSADGRKLTSKASAAPDIPYSVVYDSYRKQVLMATPSGHVYRSGNAGQSWQDSIVADKVLITAMIADPKDGSLTAVGARGTVARSNDGGAHWNIAIGNLWGANLNAAFASPDGQRLITVGTGGLLVSSEDRGSHWNILQRNLKYYIHEILPTPDNKALLAVGEQGFMIRSGDHGQTWTSVNTGMKTDVTLFSLIPHPHNQALLACGPMGSFLASNNSGMDWRVTQPVSEAGDGYFKQLVADAETGTLLAIANPGIVVRSKDEGATWQATDADTSDPGVAQAAALGQGVFIAIRGDGHVLRSTDQGLHWVTTEGFGFPLWSIYAEPASGQAWIMGTGGVFKTADRGANWQATPQAGVTLNFMVRTQASHLLAFGNAGVIMRSVDDGENWQTVDSGTQSSLRKPLLDMRGGRIFVAGRDGTVLVSQDDGQHWRALPTHTAAHLSRLWLDASGKVLVATGERIVRIELP